MALTGAFSTSTPSSAPAQTSSVFASLKNVLARTPPKTRNKIHEDSADAERLKRLADARAGVRVDALADAISDGNVDPASGVSMTSRIRARAKERKREEEEWKKKSQKKITSLLAGRTAVTVDVTKPFQDFTDDIQMDDNALGAGTKQRQMNTVRNEAALTNAALFDAIPMPASVSSAPNTIRLPPLSSAGNTTRARSPAQTRETPGKEGGKQKVLNPFARK